MRCKYGNLFLMLLTGVFVVFILFKPLPVGATGTDGKEFITEASAQVGHGNSQADAESTACTNARNSALEQATQYLTKQYGLMFSRLKQEDVRAIAAEIMTTTLLEKKPIINKNSVQIYVKMRTTLDTEQIGLQINNRQLLSKQTKQQQILATAKQMQGQQQFNGNALQSNMMNVTGQSATSSQQDNAGKNNAVPAKPNKQNCTEWLNKGYDEMQAKNYEQAILAYKKAIAIEPNNTDAHNGLGSAYYQKAQYDEAIQEFQQAIGFNNQDFYSYYNLALAYEKKNRLQDAAIAYRKFIEYAPTTDYEEQIKRATECIQKNEAR